MDENKALLCPRCSIRQRMMFRYERYGRVYTGHYKLCERCRRLKRGGGRQGGTWVVPPPPDDCPLCGFVALVPEQLEVHHRNGDRRNHALDNLIYVCANCHKLLNYVQRCYRNGWPIDPVIDLALLIEYLAPSGLTKGP